MPNQKNQYLNSRIGILGSGQYQTGFLVARFIIQTELDVKLQSALTNTQHFIRVEGVFNRLKHMVLQILMSRIPYHESPENVFLAQIIFFLYPIYKSPFQYYCHKIYFSYVSQLYLINVLLYIRVSSLYPPE